MEKLHTRIRETSHAYMRSGYFVRTQAFRKKMHVKINQLILVQSLRIPLLLDVTSRIENRDV